MFFSGPRKYRVAEQNLHTPDPGFPWLVLVRSASQEAQQLRGLDQTSWLELLLDRVVSGLECGIRAGQNLQGPARSQRTQWPFRWLKGPYRSLRETTTSCSLNF